MMGTDVYTDHGVHIRRIALGYGRGPGYQIHVGTKWTTLTWADFRDMVGILAKHLTEREDRCYGCDEFQSIQDCLFHSLLGLVCKHETGEAEG